MSNDDYINEKARQLGGILHFAFFASVFVLLCVSLWEGWWLLFLLINVALILYALSEPKRKRGGNDPDD